MEPIISIITINYNGLADTCSMIDTIPFDEYPLEVIVVDNASKQDEASIIEKRYPQVKVVRSNKNLGFAGGNNLGIQASHGRYLYFVNNDTLFFRQPKEQVKLKALVSRLESSEKIGAVCPKIRFAWANAPIQYAGYTSLSRITIRNHAIGCGEADCGQYDTPHATPYAHGAAMMVKHTVIDDVGMMPECYFLYYEEIDWSMMIRRKGYEIWYEPASTIYHKESQTTGQQSPTRQYYITRNRLLFVKRNITGITGWLSRIYLMLLVAPKDIIIATTHARKKHVQSIIRGVIDYLKL